MLVRVLIRLSALSMGLSYVTCTTPQQQSQLATLHERMNQIISALYSSPLLSKAKETTPSEETLSPPEESYSYTAAPAPQVVYLPPVTFLEAGAQPNDHGYPLTTHPLPRAAWSYDHSYQPHFAPPVYPPPLPRPYPDYARTNYPQLPSPQPLPPPFPSPVSFSPFPSTQCPAPAPFSLPYQSGYSVASTLAPYPSMSPPPPMPYPSLYPPSLPYPPSFSTPYPSPRPQQYYAPPVHSHSCPAPIPAPYPSMNSGPYSPSLSYPFFHHPVSPSFPKPSDMLSQPQYEYS